MSLVSKITSLAIPPWVPWALRGVVVLILAGLVVALRIAHSDLRAEKDHYRLAVAGALIQKAQTEQKWSAQKSTAQTQYVQSSEGLQKVKDESDADTRVFAATAAGSESCLTADRMRGIAEFASRAKAAVASGGGFSALSDSGDTSPRPK